MTVNNRNELSEAFESCTDDLISIIQACSPDLFIKKPGTDKWSIAEIAEHLNITDKSAYLAMLKKEGNTPEIRIEDTEQKMKEMLTAENVKFIAPEAAHPKGIFTDPRHSSVVLGKTRGKIIEYALHADMDIPATGFSHPRLGYLSTGQWMRFLKWHTRHHMQQIWHILNDYHAE